MLSALLNFLVPLVVGLVISLPAVLLLESTLTRIFGSIILNVIAGLSISIVLGHFVSSGEASGFMLIAVGICGAQFIPAVSQWTK
jgi:Na+/citrate or Na+/malate symporter